MGTTKPKEAIFDGTRIKAAIGHTDLDGRAPDVDGLFVDIKPFDPRGDREQLEREFAELLTLARHYAERWEAGYLESLVRRLFTARNGFGRNERRVGIQMNLGLLRARKHRSALDEIDLRFLEEQLAWLERPDQYGSTKTIAASLEKVLGRPFSEQSIRKIVANLHYESRW